MSHLYNMHEQEVDYLWGKDGSAKGMQVVCKDR